MKDLKECPFCGSSDTQLHPNYGQASCRKCHVTLEIGGFGWHHKPEDARIAWNTRASIPISKIEELIAKLQTSYMQSATKTLILYEIQKLIDKAKHG